MAHDIARINGIDAIAYVGESPWHRLGTVLNSATDLHAALAQAQLGWTVTARPLYALGDGGTLGGSQYTGTVLQAPAQAITRDTDGAILGVVGPGYHAIQHLDVFKLAQPALAAGTLTIEVAGALGNGATVWMLTRLKGVDAIVVRNGDRPGDRINPFLLFSTSHDGSRSLRIALTAIRVVCRNTIQMSESENGRGLIVRHTESAPETMRQFAARMDAAIEAFRKTGDQAQHMAETKIDASQLRAFVETLMPLPQAPKTEGDDASADANATTDAAQAGPVTIDETYRARAAARDALTTAGNSLSREFRLKAQTDANANTAELWSRWLKACDRIQTERAKVQNLACYGQGNDGSSVWDALNGVTEYIDHTAPTVADGSVSDYRLQKTAESAAFGSGNLLKQQAWSLALRAARLVAA